MCDTCRNRGVVETLKGEAMQICDQCHCRIEDGNRYEVEIFPDDQTDPVSRWVDLCERCKTRWFLAISRNRPKGVMVLIAE